MKVKKIISKLSNLTKKQTEDFIMEHPNEGDNSPKYKEISCDLLERLEDKFEGYCAMQAALLHKEDIPDEETLEGAIRVRDKYEKELLECIRQIIN